MLKEKAGYYYGALGKGCGEGILLAANDVYELKLSEEAIQLFAGFRTGMGCGSTCGSLSGAMGVLSRMYGQREDFKDLCAAFVKAFEDKLACGATDCTPIAAKYKTEEARCVAAVELGAEALEEFIDKVEGREKKAPANQGCTLTPDQIKAVIDGPNLEIGFNNKYILEILAAAECDEIMIGLNKPNTLMKVTPVEGDRFIFMLSPMHLKG